MSFYNVISVIVYLNSGDWINNTNTLIHWFNSQLCVFFYSISHFYSFVVLNINSFCIILLRKFVY